MPHYCLPFTDAPALAPATTTLGMYVKKPFHHTVIRFYKNGILDPFSRPLHMPMPPSFVMLWCTHRHLSHHDFSLITSCDHNWAMRTTIPQWKWKGFLDTTPSYNFAILRFIQYAGTNSTGTQSDPNSILPLVHGIALPDMCDALEWTIIMGASDYMQGTITAQSIWPTCTTATTNP